MTPDRPSRILLAGGGTAGHVSPLLALADCLRRRDPGVEILALSTSEGLEARLVPERGYDFATIPKVPLPRKPSGDLVRLPVNLRRAVAAAGRAIEQVDALADHRRGQRDAALGGQGADARIPPRRGGRVRRLSGLPVVAGGQRARHPDGAARAECGAGAG